MNKGLFIILFILLFLFSCSSNSFYQRQHLSGRYADKIQKPAKIHSENSAEFKLQEFPLSADNGTTELSIIFNEDTIPKVLADTAAAAKGKSSEFSNNNEEVIYFSPDSLSKINKKETIYVVDDSKQQLIFNDRLKRAAFKIFLAWLFRLLGFLGVFFYILFSGPMLFSSVASIIVFGIILLLILFASLLQNYLAFKILIDADRMRSKYPELKNLGWFYLLLGLNIYFVLIAIYYLLWMLFYGVVMLFFAAI